ncbi:MAG TPA: hypothetical protein VMY18_05290 [Acidobacteriota bacterium]|nr:hypothetical protein [Acidobacteriota bacterium]
MVDAKQLYEWCKVPADQLSAHPNRKVPFRMVKDSEEMGRLMASEFIDLIQENNERGLPTRAIVPCGPSCWYAPWVRMVNDSAVSLAQLTVFHMDECLDWQGRLLPKNHPYNFRTFMEANFYKGIPIERNVPEEQRFWPAPDSISSVLAALAEAPVDITIGGWGQDGHIAYNQARRHPFSQVSIEDIENSSMRVQENNVDTILALANRTFGAAYQFVPPMSVTLGVRECLSARSVRVYSDTGAWKQTALRVALFSDPTPEYPLTLLQKHPDTLITATRETSRHPISENPAWELF